MNREQQALKAKEVEERRAEVVAETTRSFGRLVDHARGLVDNCEGVPFAMRRHIMQVTRDLEAAMTTLEQMAEEALGSTTSSFVEAREA